MKALRAGALLGSLACALAVAAPAVAAAFEERTPAAMTLYNPCRGETFVVNGILHTVAQVDFRADGFVHVENHMNFEGMTAQSLVTGYAYVVDQNENDMTNAADGFAPFESSFDFREHFIRLGEDGLPVLGDDWYAYFHLHETINANGVPVTEINSADADCR